MKTFKKAFFLFTSALIIILTPVINAHEIAENDKKVTLINTADPKTSERQERLDALKSLNSEERCSQIETNIDRLISNYESKHETQVEKYESLSARIGELMKKLEKRGYDTSSVTELLSTLEDKVNEFSSLRNDLQSKLREAKTLVCLESDGKYSEAVVESNQILKDMRTKGKEISDFVKNNIKPAVKELKAQTI
jgi:DNA repair exonuclease SbcCD ATPase subunit